MDLIRDFLNILSKIVAILENNYTVTVTPDYDPESIHYIYNRFWIARILYACYSLRYSLPIYEVWMNVVAEGYVRKSLSPKNWSMDEYCHRGLRA